MSYVFLQHFFRELIVMNITAAFVFLILRFAVYDFPSFHADLAMAPEPKSTKAEA